MMSVKIRSWVERHPLLLFFGLTYAISWSIWGLEPMLMRLDPAFARAVDAFAPYGPAFAALALAAWLQPGRHATVRQWRRWIAAGITLLAAIWVLLEPWSTVFQSQYPLLTVPALLLLTLLPTWLVWLSFTKQHGIHKLLKTFLAWRVRPIWYFWTLLFFPLISLLGLLLWALLGQPLPPFPRNEEFPEILPLLLNVFIATAFYGGPFGEEIGWRGFALPRLQMRFSPLVASIILGVIWGVWHFPLHFRGKYDVLLGADLIGLAVRIFTGVVLAILFTWLYNRSRGNLWLMVLLHTVTNDTAGFWLPLTGGVFVAVVLAVAILVACDKMYLRLPTSSETVVEPRRRVQEGESLREQAA